MNNEQMKDLITRLESNNVSLGLLCDTNFSDNVSILELQIEMNNKQIQQLQLLNGIENVKI